MADNVEITAGAGTVIATDQVTRNAISEHEQIVKLSLGADGAFDCLVDSGQQTMANSLPVTVASDHSDIKVSLDGESLTVGTMPAPAHEFTDDAAYTVGTSKVAVSGGVAVAHSANPDAADAGDAVASLHNRHRILFVIGGHPNTVTASVRIAAATGAQTDAALLPGTISSGTKIVVTRLSCTCSNANTVNVAVKVGFGTSVIPADSTSGVADVLIDHEGVPPGGGFTIGDGSGILGVGGDGAELRLTCDAPTGGFVIISYSYYTIES